jgi:hypothetical protein
MNLQEAQLVFQSISSCAIAAGLVYTAFQFRKSRQATHVANFTELVKLQMHLREMRVNDPSLAKVYRHDMDGMENETDVRYYFFNLMQLSVFEIVWFSHRAEQIPDDYYESWLRRIKDIAHEETFQKMVKSPSMKILHDEFQRFITDLAAEAARDFVPRT